jgi:TATA-box binding protein (TBP) (component of TFIID and TFIIIB)
MYKIANVKVSIKTTPIFLDIVLAKAIDGQFYCKNFINFIVLKLKYTYIIFKKNKNSENHINITKIPTIADICEAIEIIREFTGALIKYKKVDNIIATTFLNKALDLNDICKKGNFKSIKYNNEKFPGLFIKLAQGTIILFHSGKVVVVGAKTEHDIQCLIANIYANI